MKSSKIATERRFYLGMSITILILVFLGFYRSFYLRPLFPEYPAPSYTMVYIHGALFSLWVILFTIQVTLIKKQSIRLHRILGILGGILALILVVQGMDLAISTVRSGRVDVRFGSSMPFVLPFVDILLFSSFVLLGFFYRNKPQYHKRLMLLATINLINAAVGRIAPSLGPAVPMTIFALLITAMLIWDYKSAGKLYRVTLIGGLLTIISLPLRFIFSETALWQSFEKWMIG